MLHGLLPFGVATAELEGAGDAQRLGGTFCELVAVSYEHSMRREIQLPHGGLCSSHCDWSVSRDDH